MILCNTNSKCYDSHKKSKLSICIMYIENVHEILRIACTKNESTKGTFMLNISNSN